MVLPAAKAQKGFKGAFFLADRGTGKGISIALWETETDMMASEASGYYQAQLAKMAPILAAPPVTEHFDVAVQA